MCDPPMWQVERRYHEFYVLESKLQEFHGINRFYSKTSSIAIS